MAPRNPPDRHHDHPRTLPTPSTTASADPAPGFKPLHPADRWIRAQASGSAWSSLVARDLQQLLDEGRTHWPIVSSANWRCRSGVGAAANQCAHPRAHGTRHRRDCFHRLPPRVSVSALATRRSRRALTITRSDSPERRRRKWRAATAKPRNPPKTQTAAPTNAQQLLGPTRFCWTYAATPGASVPNARGSMNAALGPRAAIHLHVANSRTGACTFPASTGLKAQATRNRAPALARGDRRELGRRGAALPLL